jgi:hypothetical protein
MADSNRTCSYSWKDYYRKEEGRHRMDGKGVRLKWVS